MAQWGRSDNPPVANTTTTKLTSNGAPTWSNQLIPNQGGGANAHFGNSAGTRAAISVGLYANSTAGAFQNAVAVGVFGVSVTEQANHKEFAHAGWIKRTVGTGGRAGRVQTEVLVAMGSLGAQTAAYGTPAANTDGDATALV